MIRSLSKLGQDHAIEADVHVVGAGIAGLLLATRLAKRGLRVVVTESGGLRQNGDRHPLNEVVHQRTVYEGAERGRARCLGGTSTLWGGAMIPFQPADMERPGEWPVQYSDFSPYLSEVEAIFGLPPGSYEERDLVRVSPGSVTSHVPRLAKWPAFQRRNMASLFRDDLRSERGPEVWLDATATEFLFTPDGRLDGVVAAATNGRRLTVKAQHHVLAAGAIESTRLLLLADRQVNGRLFRPDGPLGRYFHDHLSVCIGTIRPTNRRAVNRVAGFRFQGQIMRNLRFETSEAPEIRARVPAGFAHIAFVSEETNGFAALRDVFRQLQQRQLPRLRTLASLARATPWLTKAVWWRVMEQRLLYPADAHLELHIVVEQTPVAENRIYLSDDRQDLYGLPLAVIDWAAGPDDLAQLARSTELFMDYWTHSSLSRLGQIDQRPREEVEADLARGAGIYHPGGTTRMGHDEVQGVVDSNLRVFQIPNLSVAATSVFPTGGGANPTMMLMMATLRLADHLAALR